MMIMGPWSPRSLMGFFMCVPLGQGPTLPYYLTPKQDDFNKIPELQVCIAEALYDVDSIVAGVTMPTELTKTEFLRRVLFLAREVKEAEQQKRVLTVAPVKEPTVNQDGVG